ncbi:glutamine amidotransferase [Arthrobacter sp. ISL-5]|uniref:glutamine amidotransferase n=1 Tax=Arthrobacter sp. ISL-5 TaxID=2819111 RepID=UPI001BE583AB|nr:glutamine amidotransferase [Arthrobacter sp. ISL-5]MBT2553517.1 glutamine amidotransferase [Arthrobacter sp. ISL-5]
MKPFLLLASRAEDTAAEEEYEAYLRYGGLDPSQLRRIRMELAPLPALELDGYSGVIVGGSPFTSSDPAEKKSETQHRVERELATLLDRIVAADFPFLGACYGVGTLGLHQGAVIDRTYGEQLGGVIISLSPEGLEDPLLAGMPAEFTAFTGHKEACTVLPPNAVLLASSAACPVHMFRIKKNLYATQFHPELDAEGLVTRIDIYRHAGYFPPESAEELMAAARTFTATEPMKILRNFVKVYGT